jgi:hypothetical protein
MAEAMLGRRGRQFNSAFDDQLHFTLYSHQTLIYISARPVVGWHRLQYPRQSLPSLSSTNVSTAYFVHATAPPAHSIVRTQRFRSHVCPRRHIQPGHTYSNRYSHFRYKHSQSYHSTHIENIKDWPELSTHRFRTTIWRTQVAHNRSLGDVL